VLRVESSSSPSLQIAASLEVESKRIKEPGLPARSDLTVARPFHAQCRASKNPGSSFIRALVGGDEA
jgi:hypothetical protein